MVDTGSSGLRLLSSALAGSSLSLQTETTKDGNQIGECVQFSDTSYVWGPVKTADVYLANGNEIAYSVPIHILGDSTFSTIPSTCCGWQQAGRRRFEELRCQWNMGIGSTQYDCSFGGTNYCASGLERQQLLITNALFRAVHPRSWVCRSKCRIQWLCFPRITMASSLSYRQFLVQRPTSPAQ